ncbi:MAG: 3-methyl-2-oxobutanoate hydroxymethyltransferase, 3-methyl-2-oxobutanoate hydroxymethyltransferase [Candidatus Peregrinibacteria bacterium GW2011_GWF2_39_17]|nr:MAG: 3-methyl-2-oxobutanoate hydroxymethyltransferase, 3-methyl-2-oxobutanoate hydroxymethyltransferase [Candidatus Peregrinibacteria bacterium GW2011_GWF2_39_17]HCW32467.1 3-methyl-2-oxobutanoate hydroxymethyltransferase [Candidatus Peregrinibacteria bacterium]
MVDILRFLKGQRKIVALTAYDYSMAQILPDCGVDVLLVGDSLGMVVLGYNSTHFVTIEDMIRHTQAVMRGEAKASGSSLVVADMPIGTCDTPKSALKHCRRMVAETEVKAVKIEGNAEVCKVVIDSGIAVMGHTGLKPQTAQKMGICGKQTKEAQAIFDEAIALEKAGCFALVLECVPSSLAKRITEKLSIPTIGIGAGPDCDGQILVTHDILGLFTDFQPKFVKQYGNVRQSIEKAVRGFVGEVKSGVFPGDVHHS